MLENPSADDRQEIVDLWDRLLHTDMDSGIAIQTGKGYKSLSQSLHTAPVTIGQTVARSTDHKRNARGGFHQDTRRPGNVPHQSQSNETFTAASSTRLRPPTPIWVEGRYTPVFNTSPKEVKLETPTRVVVSKPKPKKASKMIRFFNCVSRLFHVSRQERKGWTQL
ncbi:uncharacterized protein LOC124132245 isoform X2 [Haliotis rufescens]|uniref:uncharacterized protein LOC124132245 isoform X2 n=1 Tax=Haliotis rufescens TaxID=6454 RepID=UPI001EAFC562|nr:uncharacterized protein LOC124132245 isoform X2 [Haliotis rufescens]